MRSLEAMERRVDANNFMKQQADELGLSGMEKEGLEVGIRLGKIPPFLRLTYEFRKFFKSILRVGLHESGHEYMVNLNGDLVTNVTTKASGNVLGAVSWISNHLNDREAHYNNVIKASHGGEAVEAMFNIHPDGSSHDRGLELMGAGALSWIQGFSPESVLGPLRRYTREAISGAGRNYFMEKAWQHIGYQFSGFKNSASNRFILAAS